MFSIRAWVMSMAGGIFLSLRSVLTNTFLILLTVVFILLEVADLPNKLRKALKNRRGRYPPLRNSARAPSVI